MSVHCVICDKDVDPSANSIACPDCGNPVPELRDQGSAGGSAGDPRIQQQGDAGQHDSDAARDPRRKQTQPNQSADDDGDATNEGTSTCPECGAEVKSSFKFCPQCTEPLAEEEKESTDEPVTTCPECGYDELTGDEQFCPMCTEDLQAAAADVDSGGSAPDAPGENTGDISDTSDDAPQGPVHSPGSGGSEVELEFDQGGALRATDESILGWEIRKHLHSQGLDARRAKRVSRQHLLFKRTNRGFVVVDLESANGTELNGQSLEANEEYHIEDGDELEIADVTTATVRIR